MPVTGDARRNRVRIGWVTVINALSLLRRCNARITQGLWSNRSEPDSRHDTSVNETSAGTGSALC
jgi:hypothetical protein